MKLVPGADQRIAHLSWPLAQDSLALCHQTGPEADRRKAQRRSCRRRAEPTLAPTRKEEWLAMTGIPGLFGRARREEREEPVGLPLQPLTSWWASTVRYTSLWCCAEYPPLIPTFKTWCIGAPIFGVMSSPGSGALSSPLPFCTPPS